MKHFIFRYGLTVLFCLCSVALTSASAKSTGKGTTSLKHAKPDKKLDAAMENYLQAAKDQNLNIQSVMVLQHGKVKYETYSIIHVDEKFYIKDN